MTKIHTIFVLILFGILGLYGQENKTNILLVIADDMGIDVTNGYQQNELMPTTPTLDSLRATGITYKNAWASPTCTPTRASIMSGKYGVKTGVMRAQQNLEVSDTSVFNMLTTVTNDAYAKAVIGKWHISNPVDYDHPQQHGIDHYEGLFSALVEDYYDWEKVTNGTVSRETEYVTSYLTNAAINWVNDQNKPWLLWLAHAAPHSPFHVPPTGLYTTANTRTNQEKYIAAIEAMDHEIGRFIHNLDPLTKQNTIVLFIGDNGTPGPVVQNFGREHSKASLYEGGIRVPMIVSGNGVSRSNEEEEDLVQVSDIYATLLELAGHQLQGGIHNSLSIKPSFNCTDELKRNYLYVDFEEDDLIGWAIRNDQYKLIEYENGTQELYDIQADLLEQNNLMGSLTTEQEAVMTELSNEANTIRTGWSCKDGISNGDETGIDGCTIACTAVDSLNTGSIGCCISPEVPSVFYEYSTGDKRNIYTNNFPNHDYCYKNEIPEPKHYHFSVDQNPVITDNIFTLVRSNDRPWGYFGVSKNGVVMAPAPAQPFIFENPNTGEYNWDWMFEPTNNKGDGMGILALDCASAHIGPQGYHYHGDMYQYLETIQPESTTTSQPPSVPIHIGWAADGFPIVYRFGPDNNGNIKELLPSFQLRSGERPGDGIEAPCGPYNGKYTRDYEYTCGKGNLDECNGTNTSITLPTANGMQTFDYFYVITSAFPQIPRCLVGNVSDDFDNTTPDLVGEDNDGDGFIAAFDCDDTDSEINPLTDQNCALSATTLNFDARELYVGPNPSQGDVFIEYQGEETLQVRVYDFSGRSIRQLEGKKSVHIQGLTSGLYFIQIAASNGKEAIKKMIIN